MDLNVSSKNIYCSEFRDGSLQIDFTFVTKEIVKNSTVTFHDISIES